MAHQLGLQRRSIQIRNQSRYGISVELHRKFDLSEETVKTSSKSKTARLAIPTLLGAVSPLEGSKTTEKSEKATWATAAASTSEGNEIIKSGHRATLVVPAWEVQLTINYGPNQSSIYDVVASYPLYVFCDDKVKLHGYGDKIECGDNEELKLWSYHIPAVVAYTPSNKTGEFLLLLLVQFS